MSLSKGIFYLKPELYADVLDPGIDVGVHSHVLDARGAFEGGSQPRHLESSEQLDGTSVLPDHHLASDNL